MNLARPILRRPALWVCLVLTLATAAAYWPVTGHQFINYDDQDYLTSNPNVQSGLSWNSIRWAFTTDYAGNWHPLTWISHMTDCQLFGLNPAGHHATNLLFHLANSILVFLLFRKLTGSLLRSTLLAAFFAWHPLHVESVAWASERKDVLSAFFFLLALQSYGNYARRLQPASSKAPPDRHHAWRHYALALFLFSCGLLSKPMLVTLPFVLLLLDYWPLQRFPTRAIAVHRGAMLRLLAEKVPFLALALASSIVTFIVQRKTGTVSSIDVLPLDARFENAVVSYLLYIVKLFWPLHLAPFYPYNADQPFGLVGLAGIFLVAASSAVIVCARRAPYLPVGWFWYLGMLVPVIGLVQVGLQAMADRYSYLPSIGIGLAVIWGVADLTARIRIFRLPASIAAGIALPVLFVVTRLQVNHWQNSETIFRHTLAVTQENPVAHHCLGCVLVEQDKVEEAEKHFAEAVRLRPTNYEARNNLGLALVIRGQLDNAIEQYQIVLRSHPELEKTHYNLGRALQFQGQTNAALEQFQEAIRLNPGFVEARRDFAEALSRLGRQPEAIEQWIVVVKLAPHDAAARANLESLTARPTMESRSAAELEQAIKLNPADVEAHRQLGLILADQGKIQDAIAQFREVLRLHPDARAHYNLALALVIDQQAALAIREYRAALELDPDLADALNDLAWLLATHPDSTLRNGPEAVKLAEHACALTQRTQPRMLGTLDAAYAEAGRFPEAQQTAEETKRLAIQVHANDVARAAEQRLALYRAGKSFRQ